MRRSLLALAVLAAAAGCARIPFTESQPTPTADEGVWGEVRQRFTRSGKVYDGLGTNAFASAVYEPLEAREARIERLAVWKKLTPEEREALLVTERDQASRFDDFLVSIFTPARPDNDLSSKRSIWRVALIVPGEGDLLPETIEEVRIDSTVLALYPNVGDFDVLYRVRFKRRIESLAARSFTLRLAGSRGRLDLEYGRKP
ncbi:MAG TPA: hypothetical protein VEM76_15095 [Anaeromyxobacteraceae bacterium]|nr:hypothetical protein [Anaeromyxobacteraceae bacterium]